MSHVVLLCPNGTQYLCPFLMLDRRLLALLQQRALVLVSVLDLKDGVSYRYTHVGQNDKPFDLRNYIQIHNQRREIVATIMPSSVLFDEDPAIPTQRPDDPPQVRRLDPAEPVVVPEALMCDCGLCLQHRAQ